MFTTNEVLGWPEQTPCTAAQIPAGVLAIMSQGAPCALLPEQPTLLHFDKKKLSTFWLRLRLKVKMRTVKKQKMV